MSSARAENEGTTYVIGGGGCYGSDYVRQLKRAAESGAIKLDRIVIVDRDPECAVARAYAEDPSVEIAHSEYRTWVHSWWHRRQELREAQWVPPPIAPHIVKEWSLELLNRTQGQRWRDRSFDMEAPSDLPFASVLPSGSLALSHAPGTCPVHCIEPRTCPLTKGPRTWEMKETVRELLADSLDVSAALGLVQCQHHAYGVGTIPFSEIIDVIERLLSAAGNHDTSLLAVATVSSCHGLVDLVATDHQN